MRDPRPRLPCPVCSSTLMERRTVGPPGHLEVDLCGRCQGVWLEHGEVRRLRAVAAPEALRALRGRPSTLRPRCHGCHGPLDRAEERCPACGRENRLDCPACARPMRVEEHAGLRLDVCRGCRGIWFDAHEIGAVWSLRLDRSVEARAPGSAGTLAVAGEAVGEGALSLAVHAPGAALHGTLLAADAAAHAASGFADLPGALVEAPGAAAGLFETMGSAAEAVFEALVDVVAAVFGGLG